MGKKVIFRKIRGRLVPIKVSEEAKDLAAGGAAFFGATVAANKARKKLSEVSQGKGKKSFGALPNLAFEVGASAAILTALAKKGPVRLRYGVPAFGRVLQNSFGISRKLGRGK